MPALLDGLDCRRDKEPKIRRVLGLEWKDGDVSTNAYIRRKAEFDQLFAEGRDTNIRRRICDGLNLSKRFLGLG